MRQESLHLTLAFLGNVPESALPDLLRLGDNLKAEPFQMRLDRLDYWPHNHILWAGCTPAPAALLALAEELRQHLARLGHTQVSHSFTPHVTLLRQARTGAPDTLPLCQPLSWPVTEFRLVESRPGADYRAIGRWLLGSA